MNTEIKESPQAQPEVKVEPKKEEVKAEPKKEEVIVSPKKPEVKAEPKEDWIAKLNSLEQKMQVISEENKMLKQENLNVKIEAAIRGYEQDQLETAKLLVQAEISKGVDQATAIATVKEKCKKMFVKKDIPNTKNLFNPKIEDNVNLNKEELKKKADERTIKSGLLKGVYW